MKRLPLTGVIAVLGLGMAIGLAGPNLFGWYEANAARPRPVTPRGALTAAEKSTIALFKRAGRSTVHIRTTTRRVNQWTRNVDELPRGTGTGIIWDKEGHVVTNFHVLQGATSAQVLLHDHSSYEAKLVGVAPGFDMAVLKIEAPAVKLTPVDIGTSHDLEVGQQVLAIGNPFGLDQTLTTGIVSALDRTINAVTGRPIEDVIQTDAAINPGNSGGPLLDSAGRLIGMNTAIVSKSGGSAGIGFAVPVDTVNRVVPQLIVHGRIVRPQLGVRLDERISAIVTERLNVKGVLVIEVVEGAAAAEAGLRGSRIRDDNSIIPGDIITHVDGQAVASRFDLLPILENHRPGDKVEMTLWYRGKSRKAKVKLSAPVNGTSYEDARRR